MVHFGTFPPAWGLLEKEHTGDAMMSEPLPGTAGTTDLSILAALMWLHGLYGFY